MQFYIYRCSPVLVNGSCLYFLVNEQTTWLSVSSLRRRLTGSYRHTDALSFLSRKTRAKSHVNSRTTLPALRLNRTQAKLHTAITGARQ